MECSASDGLAACWKGIRWLAAIGCLKLMECSASDGLAACWKGIRWLAAIGCLTHGVLGIRWLGCMLERHPMARSHRMPKTHGVLGIRWLGCVLERHPMARSHRMPNSWSARHPMAWLHAGKASDGSQPSDA